MEKVLVLLLVMCVVRASQRHHPKFPRSLEESEITHFKKVACITENERLRHRLIEESMCGPPREVFVELKPRRSYEQISPSAVWVKRCVGLCDGDGSKCEPRETVTKHIPIRVMNVKDDKESCSTYPVVEHVTCGCGCPAGASDCSGERVFNPPDPEYEVEPI